MSIRPPLIERIEALLVRGAIGIVGFACVTLFWALLVFCVFGGRS